MWIHKVEYPSKSADSCSLRRERTAPGISPGVSERTRFSLEPSGIKRWILRSLLLLNSLFYLTSVWRATKLHVRREEQPGGTEQPEVRIMMSFAGAQTQTAILAAVGGSRARASAPTGMTLNWHSQEGKFTFQSGIIVLVSIMCLLCVLCDFSALICRHLSWQPISNVTTELSVSFWRF